MASYHLYYLRGGMLIGSGHVDAEDDREAALIARRTGEGELVEIWNDHRRIRIVVPDGTGSATAHPPAG